MPHRPDVHKWYCTASWARRRRHQLRVEPLCRLCLESARVTPATVADHVVPHRGDFTAFRLGPLRSLCADCHNRLDANNAPLAPVREDGTPSDPTIRGIPAHDNAIDGDGYFRRPLGSMEKMMEMDDELRALKREQERFDFVVEDAKRYFGQWDMCDPVVWAILRVVQAQNDFADAMDQVAAYGVDERVVEAAIKERREAIAALQEALEDEPRGFQ